MQLSDGLNELFELFGGKGGLAVDFQLFVFVEEGCLVQCGSKGDAVLRDGDGVAGLPALEPLDHVRCYIVAVDWESVKILDTENLASLFIDGDDEVILQQFLTDGLNACLTVSGVLVDPFLELDTFDAALQ